MKRGKSKPAIASGEKLRPLDPLWARYCRFLARCQRQLTEDRLHDFRVQTRRLLAGLEVFAPLAGGPASIASLRKSLSKRLAALGPLRDAQVHLRDFNLAMAAHPEISPLHHRLRRRERRLLKSARAKLTRTGTGKLGRRIARFSDRLAAAIAAEDAAATVGAAFAQRLADAMTGLERVRRAKFRYHRAVHAVRVLLKQLRYGAECLPAAQRGATPAQLKRVRKCVSLMGRMHDIDVQLARLDKLVAKGHLPPTGAESYRAELRSRRVGLGQECLEFTRPRRTRRPRPAAPSKAKTRAPQRKSKAAKLVRATGAAPSADSTAWPARRAVPAATASAPASSLPE